MLYFVLAIETTVKTMLYYSLKILHVISAALLLTSIGYCYYLWGRARHTKECGLTAAQIQAQTWFIILPVVIFQLASGFTLFSLKQEDFSQLWIFGSVIGFMIVIGSWFSFIYLLTLSQQLTLHSKNITSIKFKTFRYLQSTMLCLCAAALFIMIFLMTNKIN
jgi:uncharacterized membrane protein